jgi:3-(3-hydroxy-phenyl)propionate hydroxylase
MPPGFVWLYAGETCPALPPGISPLPIGPAGLQDLAGKEMAGEDMASELADRFGLDQPGGYLIRPDRHVAARFRNADAACLAAAHQRALGHAHVQGS